MRVLLGVILVSILGACSFQAQECCDCMGTKDTIFGDCVTDTRDVCVSELSKSPPNVDVIQSVCRADPDNGFCTESCKDILYKN